MLFILPLIFGAVAVLTGGVGVLAGLDGMANEEQAKEIAEDTQARHEYACEAIEELHEATQELAAEYGELQLAVKQNTIGRFIALIEQIDRTGSYQDRAFLESFKGTKPQQIREYQAVRSNAIFISTGGTIVDTLVGNATDRLVQLAAGKGTLALVGLFGHASTGGQLVD